eukprot:COSAG02_NODE_34699_length_480_cov_0.540682_1_plen_28_part_10
MKFDLKSLGDGTPKSATKVRILDRFNWD